MRPSDRAIRDELRRESARVQIPSDMWTNISKELAKDEKRKQGVQYRLSEWQQYLRPAANLGIAAGVFWLTVIPFSQYLDRQSAHIDEKPAIVQSTVSEPRQWRNIQSEPIFPTPSLATAPAKAPSSKKYEAVRGRGTTVQPD